MENGKGKMERGTPLSHEGKAFKPFEEFDLWKRAFALSVAIYRLTKEAAFDKDWALRDQIRRAAISIPSNIAEGYERRAPTEFRQFLSIAKGSCGEVRTQLQIAAGVEMVDSKRCDPLIAECKEVSAMIGGFMKSLQVGK
jgi:four helix bundle protein